MKTEEIKRYADKSDSDSYGYISINAQRYPGIHLYTHSATEWK